MCEVCQHINIYAKVKQFDPTHTTSLRNAFANDMSKRFKKLISLIEDAIVTKDVFGLQNKLFSTNAAAPNQFAFGTSDAKVQAFMEWLRQMVQQELLTIKMMSQVGAGLNQAWTNMYVEDSYKRGIARAKYEMKKAGYLLPEDIFDKSVAASFNNPFHMDRVGMLYSRVYSDLKGITDQMDTQISKVLAQGMIDGENPRTMARKMRAVIEGGGEELGITDTLGRFIPAKRRAEILARTETVRAYHQANIQEMKNWGIEGVSVVAEWSTAEDDRVCDKCKAMTIDEDGQLRIYTLDEIQNLIPLHPNCRCLALPVSAQSTGEAAKAIPIIEAIVEIILNSGRAGVTKQEILEQLIARFPDKDPAWLQGTINIQVPSRINKQRFQLERIEGNKYRKKEGEEIIPTREPIAPVIPEPIVKPEPEPMPEAIVPTEKVIEDWKPINNFKGDDVFDMLQKYHVSDVYCGRSASALLRANRAIQTMANIFNTLPKLYAMNPRNVTFTIAETKNPTGHGPYTMGVYRYAGTEEIEIGTAPMIRTTPTLSIGKSHNVGVDFDNTIRHEYGHHVWHKVLSFDVKQKFRDFYTEISKVEYPKDPSKYFAKKVSKYAGTQVGEAWAECFAAYTSPLYGTSDKYRLPKEIEDIMKELVGERSTL